VALIPHGGRFLLADLIDCAGKVGVEPAQGLRTVDSDARLRDGPMGPGNQFARGALAPFRRVVRGLGLVKVAHRRKDSSGSDVAVPGAAVRELGQPDYAASAGRLSSGCTMAAGLGSYRQGGFHAHKMEAARPLA
jgi:hypothetical protein